LKTTKPAKMMGLSNAWINSYNSLMKLQQDPVTGMLTGTYSSTTGGTGTYDIVGWAALNKPTTKAGQGMAISILWRSNDGGKSDPSHEVSGMAGQNIFLESGENLELLHLFVETNPNTTPKLGFYPDKLTFTPSTDEKNMDPHQKRAEGSTTNASNQLLGTWTEDSAHGSVAINIEQKRVGGTEIKGAILYPDGQLYPIVGFTDIFALPPKFNRQGVTFCTYVDGSQGRTCKAFAGYLDLTTNSLVLKELAAQSTAANSTWYQTHLSNLVMHKKER
jgi:hypothetical protein